ncbi:hypothetical protein BJ684DRAFT_20314 [Piptocephalis cylindrospora]|uniref:Uncharacterized protein n=1 Tax=Piptocephalis cylindrospora TaxID=1907219 RepID=A0A4V1IY35_9FUNG|nr:hypothetical protein BJ684DRAFT_20314 [Piptocephalis cylindrospora]|eukprot:RKP13179.1 hypothetical protein BJ684DRAFT_20314 [Piptocephalis cylindrospora]
MSLPNIIDTAHLPENLEFSRPIYLHHLASLLIVTLYTCVATRNFSSALTILFNRPAPALSHWLCCAHTFVALSGSLVSLLRKVFPFFIPCPWQTTILMSLAVLGEPAIIAVLASKAYYSRKRPPFLRILGAFASLISGTIIFLGLWGTRVVIDTPWVCNVSHATWWFLVKCLCVDLPINILFSTCFLLVMWRQAESMEPGSASIYIVLGRDGLIYLTVVSIMGIISVSLSLSFQAWAPHVHGLHFILASTLLVLQMERGANRPQAPPPEPLVSMSQYRASTSSNHPVRRRISPVSTTIMDDSYEVASVGSIQRKRSVTSFPQERQYTLQGPASPCHPTQILLHHHHYPPLRDLPRRRIMSLSHTIHPLYPPFYSHHHTTASTIP